jgi:type II secretory pathway pseudopilin PulG
MFARTLTTLRSARGFTLVELLVAMASGIIVGGALLAVIAVAQHQTTQITDRVTADQTGRRVLERLQDELHSSCVGGSEIPIQKPEGTLTGLEALNSRNLWFVTSYGDSNENSGEAALEEGFLHDINWTETGTVTINEKPEKVGTLTDYWFKNEEPEVYSPPSRPWKFPEALSTSSTKVTKRVLAKDVIPPERGTTVFRYYKYNTASSNALVELTSTELASASEPIRRSLAEVKFEYQQAPEPHKSGQSPDVRIGHTTNVSGAIALRLTPSEPTEEGTSTCE